MDKKLTHLEMIQGVVNRMGTNSFLLKGWTITLVAALFALAQKESNSAYMFLAYFPAIIFWGLDGYYLWQEKLFRKLYDKVRTMNESDIDFSMSTTSVSKEAGSFIDAILSRTVLPFYGVVVLAILFVIYISSR